jgi:glycosyltransferase involved in cell wall biosynthesis
MPRIFLYTNLVIQDGEVFWHRDLGLLTQAFRSLGHDAWLVVHPKFESASKMQNQKSKIPKEPVIWASPSDVRSPSWWQSQKPDLVIFGLWTRPKYDPIRRAALSATPRVIERADSDGMRTASCGLRTYARRRYEYFRDRTYRWPFFLSVLASVLYSFASILATPWIEARLAKTLKLLPAVAVETPQAHELWKKLALKLGADPKRIHCIPHPIQTDIFKFDSAIRKKNQIISVGRWESFQKNLPLLLKTLASFLEIYPNWTALVVGSGLLETPPHPRIVFSDPLAAPELARRMQASRIFLSSSRYESFGLAAAEAACCGCLVVGPTGLSLPGMGHSSCTNLLARLQALVHPSAGASVVAAGYRCSDPQQVAGKFLGILKCVEL